MYWIFVPNFASYSKNFSKQTCFSFSFLSVLPKSDPVPETYPSLTYSPEGVSVSLENSPKVSKIDCNAKPSNQPIKTFWFKKGVPIDLVNSRKY